MEKQGILLEKKTSDGKVLVQSTPRPIGTFSCFISEGDDFTIPHSVGGGTPLKLDHQIGDPLEQAIYADFDVIENKTYVQEGYGMWTSANFDRVVIEAVPKTTTYISGTDTLFNLYGGYLIIPAAGDGTISVQSQDINLVEVPFSIDDSTVRQSSAFWDADYNIGTHSFENIRPAPLGNGQYNIFGTEICFERIVSLTILGDHSINLKTADIAEIAHGTRVKLTFTTFPPDHAWKIAVALSVHRKYVTTY
jgi:hypothetical protein